MIASRRFGALLAFAVGMAVGSAKAADLAMLSPRPVSNWTGFYVGGTAGAGQDWTKTNEIWSWTENFPANTLVGVGGGPLVTSPAFSAQQIFSDQYRHSSLGAVGGLETGYNWQTGRWVYGIEGDLSLSSQSSTTNYSAGSVPAIFPPLPNFFFVSNTSQGWTSNEKIEWLTTLRGRAGFDDNGTLWFGTAGLAAARIGTNYLLTSSPGFSGLVAAAGPIGPGSFAQFGLAQGTQAHFATTKVGWVLGGGVETSFNRLFGFGTSNWTAKVEYLFADLGTINNTVVAGLAPVCASTCTNPATGSTSFVSSMHIYEQIVRVGLNYNFGGGPTTAPAPVIAKARPAASNWRGFYAGASAGVAEDSSKTSESWAWTENFPTGSPIGVNGGPLVTSTQPLSFNQVFSNQYHHSALGAIGGLNAGYNWQAGAWVYGLEGDFSASSQSDSTTYSAAPPPAIFPPLPNFFFIPNTTQGWVSTERIDWLTTIRGRLGVAIDDSLWYGTAGLAVARIGTNYQLTSSPGFAGLATASGRNLPGTFAQFGLAQGVTAHFGDTAVGWAVGGGVETSFNRLFGFGSSPWTARLEYMFVDLGTVNHAITAPLAPVCAATCTNPATGTTNFLSSIHVYEQTLKFGVNYRFGQL